MNVFFILFSAIQRGNNAYSWPLREYQISVYARMVSDPAGRTVDSSPEPQCRGYGGGDDVYFNNVTQMKNDT